ncbi:MAG: hypothetical protein ABJV60_00045 [Lentilitoribacter sp.]
MTDNSNTTDKMIGSTATGSSVRKTWAKPDLLIIDDTSATNASKPSNPPFESSPNWGVS